MEYYKHICIWNQLCRYPQCSDAAFHYNPQFTYLFIFLLSAASSIRFVLISPGNIGSNFIYLCVPALLSIIKKYETVLNGNVSSFFELPQTYSMLLQ